MSRVRGAALSLMIASLVFAAACGDPPEKEMQQAQGAIDAARAAGADQYAHAEFAAAQEALKQAHAAVDQRDYQAALNHALDSRERAQNAAKEAADHKAVARVDADKALTDAVAALDQARAKLKAADSARMPPRTLADPRRRIADGDRAVQKARAAFDSGDYLKAADLARPASANLRGATRDLEQAMSPSARRRR